MSDYAQLELAEHGFLDKYRQVSLDEEYVERISFRTDLAILWRTAEVLLGPKGSRPPLARFEPDRAGAAVRAPSGPGNGVGADPQRDGSYGP